jgi:hypothetical protein
VAESEPVAEALVPGAEAGEPEAEPAPEAEVLTPALAAGKEREEAQPEPEPVALTAGAESENGQPEPGSAITEPVLSAFEEPAPLAPTVPPEQEREKEPEAQPTPDVRETLVAWPGAAAAAVAAPENGAPAEASSFEEATSVIPAWQQTDPNADSKRTVSLQALPPEEVASGAGFAAMLTFETGPFAGRMVALPSQMVTIGRAPDNDVVVGDPATSGHHGRIEVRQGSFWISDLGSTNGTLVNGEPVIEKQLSDGDMIAIGQNTLRFTLEA